MTELNNREYYVARAKVARRLSIRASNPAIAKIHSEMAREYEKLAAASETSVRSPELLVVSD